jgi:hypothetical protein
VNQNFDLGSCVWQAEANLLHICWIHQFLFTQQPASFGVFATQQVTFTIAGTFDFAVGSDFKAFGCGFPCFLFAHSLIVLVLFPFDRFGFFTDRH